MNKMTNPVKGGFEIVKSAGGKFYYIAPVMRTLNKIAYWVLYYEQGVPMYVTGGKPSNIFNEAAHFGSAEAAFYHWDKFINVITEYPPSTKDDIINSLRDEAAKQQSLLNTQAILVSDLRASHQRTIDSKDITIKELKKEVALRDSTIYHLRQEIDKHKDKHNKQGNTIDDLKEVVAQKDEEIGRLTRRVRALELLNSDLDAKVNTSTSAELQKVQGQLTNLQIGYDTQKQSIKSYQREVASLTDKIVEKDAVILRQDQQFDSELNARIGELVAAKDAEIARLVRDVHNFNLALSSQTRNIELKGDKITRLQGQVKEQGCVIAKYQNQQHDLEDAIKTKNLDISRLEHALNIQPNAPQIAAWVEWANELMNRTDFPWGGSVEPRAAIAFGVDKLIENNKKLEERMRTLKLSIKEIIE